MKSFSKWYPVIVMLAIDQAFAIGNILLKKIVSDGINHLVFITYRQAISAVFLTPLALFFDRNSRPVLTSGILCNLFLSAILGASLPQFFFLLGIEYTSATFSCAFLNMIPVLTFLMALPFRLEAVNIKRSSGQAKVFGALMCLSGSVLLASYKGKSLFHFSRARGDVARRSPSRLGPRGRWALGSGALFAGTLFWSSWFLVQTNIGNKYPCQYSSTMIMTYLSAVQSAVLGLAFDRDLSVWVLKKKTDIFIVLYAGIVGSGLCYVGMSWCVKKRGPLFTAAFSPLVQIMAALIEVPFLQEQLHLGSLIGSVVVVIGLYVMLWGKDREMQQKELQMSLQSSPSEEGDHQAKNRDAAEFRGLKVEVECEKP